MAWLKIQNILLRLVVVVSVLMIPVATAQARDQSDWEQRFLKAKQSGELGAAMATIKDGVANQDAYSLATRGSLLWDPLVLLRKDERVWAPQSNKARGEELLRRAFQRDPEAASVVIAELMQKAPAIQSKLNGIGNKWCQVAKSRAWNGKALQYLGQMLIVSENRQDRIEGGVYLDLSSRYSAHVKARHILDLELDDMRAVRRWSSVIFAKGLPSGHCGDGVPKPSQVPKPISAQEASRMMGRQWIGLLKPIKVDLPEELRDYTVDQLIPSATAVLIGPCHILTAATNVVLSAETKGGRGDHNDRLLAPFTFHFGPDNRGAYRYQRDTEFVSAFRREGYKVFHPPSMRNDKKIGQSVIRASGNLAILRLKPCLSPSEVGEFGGGFNIFLSTEIGSQTWDSIPPWRRLHAVLYTPIRISENFDQIRKNGELLVAGHRIGREGITPEFVLRNGLTCGLPPLFGFTTYVNKNALRPSALSFCAEQQDLGGHVLYTIGTVNGVKKAALFGIGSTFGQSTQVTMISDEIEDWIRTIVK